MTDKKTDKILNQGKAKELLEAEAIEMANPENDVSELDKKIIEQDSESKEEAAEIIEEERMKKVRRKALQTAKKKVNEEVPDRLLTQKPTGGNLMGHVELHMAHTYGLLLGREYKKNVVGLYGAAKKTNIVIGGFKKGCLYASRMLIDIENDMDILNDRLKTKEIEAQRTLQNLTRIKMERFVSRSPAQPELRFVNPYSFHYIDLLVRYDDLLRKLFPYYQTKLIDNNVFTEITNEFGRRFRRLFQKSYNYFYVGPESFAKQDETYLHAVTHFGELDPKIVTREVAPHLVALPSHIK